VGRLDMRDLPCVHRVCGRSTRILSPPPPWASYAPARRWHHIRSGAREVLDV
jgi:hypothetical protein